jgi:hypothetical protein
VRRAQLDPHRSHRGEPSEAKGRRDPEARQRGDWIRRIFWFPSVRSSSYVTTFQEIIFETSRRVERAGKRWNLGRGPDKKRERCGYERGRKLTVIRVVNAIRTWQLRPD